MNYYPKNIYCNGFVGDQNIVDESFGHYDIKPDKNLMSDNIEYIRADLVPKWHKYPEEKPLIEDAVLFCTGQITTYGWYIGDDTWEDSDHYKTKHIIAWMKLPKPYKE